MEGLGEGVRKRCVLVRDTADALNCVVYIALLNLPVNWCACVLDRESAQSGKAGNFLKVIRD